MNNLTDTIAAISTPIGEGGISVIRVSGENTFQVVEKVFSKSKESFKKINNGEINSHTIHFGYLYDDDSIIDEVLISIFKSPNSYTGEDVVEISSHGGVFVTQKVLGLVIKNGAIHAEPGEFTKRAFLNGRMDLSQAEAVADLIHAKTNEAHASSIKQLEGSLSGYVKKVREDLISVTALVELELDFAEEDLEFAHKKDLQKRAKNIICDLEEIIGSYINGKVIREGVNVVIAGKPNSGKSSLFNALLKTERAIVSEISGTTRDYLEENLIINGILFNLTDTAGLRTTEDIIETEGIKRSYDRIKDADLIIFLVDSSAAKEEINSSLEYYNRNIKSNNSILVYTKADICLDENIKKDNLVISVNDVNLLGKLKTEMTKKVSTSLSAVKSDKIILTNLRHKICLENTVASLNNVIKSIDDNMSGEFISIDLRTALTHLGEITGSVTNDDILHYVFSKFCIGK